MLEILASQNLQADQLPCAWFAASEIHLDGSDKRDLVMIGKGMLQGANVTTLWVFAQRPQGLKVLLTLPAHDLLIKPTRTNGYRNIQAIMMTAGRSFDGDTPFRWKEYRVHEDSTKSIH